MKSEREDVITSEEMTEETVLTPNRVIQELYNNSIQSARIDSRAKVWNFSKVSGTVSFSETLLNFHTLTRLSIRERLNEFCRRESFKT